MIYMDVDKKDIMMNEGILDKIKIICEQCTEVHDNFNKRNRNSICQVDNKKKMNIVYEEDFKLHLSKKLTRLNNRLKILQIKYSNYKKWYDRFNIMIIIISSLLSIFEALRMEVGDKIEEGTHLEIFFNMVPIGISSTITCSAAIIKFKKYQEKMENMQYTREKVILAISKIKSVQESLWFNNDSEFEAIKMKYLEDVYSVYNESNSELDRHIKISDLDKIKKCNDEKTDKSTFNI
tara:strand:+ start:1234 stop:1941 length:708 start_codon:yes stop_codon:yes gene_type:complete